MFNVTAEFTELSQTDAVIGRGKNLKPRDTRVARVTCDITMTSAGLFCKKKINVLFQKKRLYFRVGRPDAVEKPPPVTSPT